MDFDKPPFDALKRVQLALEQAQDSDERARLVRREAELLGDAGARLGESTPRWDRYVFPPAMPTIDFDDALGPRRFVSGRLVRGPIRTTAERFVREVGATIEAMAAAPAIDAGVLVPSIQIEGLYRRERVFDFLNHEARVGTEVEGIEIDSAKYLGAWLDERFGIEDWVIPLSQSAALSACSDVELDLTWVDPEGAQALLESPHLAGVETLRLRGRQQVARSFAPLARPGSMPRLRRLELLRPDDQDGPHRFGAALLELLACGEHRALTALVLPRAELSGEALVRFLDAKSMGALETLELEGAELGDEGFGLLARCEGLARIRDLRLDDCLGIDEEGELAQGGAGVEAFVRSSWLRAETLDLRWCRGAVASLVDARVAPGVRALAVSIANSEVEALSRCSRLTRLEHLHLHEDMDDPPDDGLESLADAPFLGQLRSLCVRSYAELPGLFGAPSLTSLAHLGLPATSQNVRAVARSPHLRGLHTLELDLAAGLMSRDRVDPEALVDVLLASTHLPNLAYLLLAHPFADELMARLRARWTVVVPDR